MFQSLMAVTGLVSLALAPLSTPDIRQMEPGLTSLELVTVGNAGNPPSGYGAVAYPFLVGKYEVTAGQYNAFLNAVAATDAHDLYNERMADGPFRCGIERTGDAGGYSYSVPADWANRPVNHVSWGDAARFANWLHNGQPTGQQDDTTTEDGAYPLHGAVTDEALIAIDRQSDWRWAIPSEDEWVKAAYHDGPTDHYYAYPTSSDELPSNALTDPDGGNNANYYTAPGIGFTIGDPYYLTEVGAFENSSSPYGTFDQGGNVLEWNEAKIDNGFFWARGVRGGSFGQAGGYDMLIHNRRSDDYPSKEKYSIGFRIVARIPASAALGDYNGDGSIDPSDYAYWSNAYQAILDGRWPDYAADGNLDGLVDPSDYAYWSGKYQVVLVSGAATVPEPTTLALFVIVLSVVGRRGSRVVRR